MYRWMRATHGLAGLALASVLTMYALTGVVMIYGEGQRVPASREESKQPLPDAWRGLRGPQLSAAVRSSLGLRGRADLPRRKAGRTQIIFRRPGARSEVTLDSASGSVEIVRFREGWVRTLAQLHQQNGYEGTLLNKLWAATVDLAALALILFAASGVYLWWKLGRQRRLGLAVLVVASGYSLASLAWLVFGP